jgi:hypothetical protein
MVHDVIRRKETSCDCLIVLDRDFEFLWRKIHSLDRLEAGYWSRKGLLYQNLPLVRDLSCFYIFYWNKLDSLFGFNFWHIIELFILPLSDSRLALFYWSLLWYFFILDRNFLKFPFSRLCGISILLDFFILNICFLRLFNFHLFVFWLIFLGLNFSQIHTGLKHLVKVNNLSWSRNVTKWYLRFRCVWTAL